MQAFAALTPQASTQQDLSWGVLGINTNKSVYVPGEIAKLAIAVLDQTGAMACTAFVHVEIRTPDNGSFFLSTEYHTIIVNPECSLHSYVTKPDFEGYYKIGSTPGHYVIKVTARTKAGTKILTDSFEVRQQRPFDIERHMQTRIYPVLSYPARYIIHFSEDFKGAIQESVPDNFSITSLPFFPPVEIQQSGNRKKLLWRISAKKGQTISLGFSFKSPEVSPQFYTLGPLQFKLGNQMVIFQEARLWQLAIDTTFTQIATDTYTRTNQTLWGTASDGHAWGADASTDSTHFSISSNQGLITGSGAIKNGTLGSTITDGEVLMVAKSTAFASSTSDIGAILRYTASDNWYKGNLEQTAVVIRKDVAGTVSVVASCAFSPSTNTLYSIRFRVVGTQLYVRVWPSSGSEPSDWTCVGSDSSLSAAGNAGVGSNLESGQTITVTSFSAWSLSNVDSTVTSSGTQLSTDTYTRANQNFWGTASDGNTWASDASNNAKFTITSNTGNITTGVGVPGLSGTLGASAINGEALIKGQISSFSNSGAFGAALRLTSDTNWYKATIESAGIFLRKDVSNAGIVEIADSGTTVTPATGTDYWLRFRLIGAQLCARLWLASGSEPSDWTLCTSDSSISATGNAAVIANTANSGSGVTYKSFTSWSQSAPNAPTQNSPANNATQVSTSPVFLATATDPDSDKLRYKITIFSNSGCTAVVQTNDENSSQTGWSNQNATISTTNDAYISGTQVSYTTQTPLSTGTQYWWKASAIDPQGINTFTDSSTCNTFTTQSPTLSISTPSSTTLSAVTISATNQTGTGNLGTITATDSRGTNVGWTLTLSSSDFTNGSHTLPMANSLLDINPGSVTLISGSLTGVSAGSSHTLTSTSDTTTILSASAGNGNGSYSINPGLTLTVPVGSYAGSYTATITETIQ